MNEYLDFVNAVQAARRRTEALSLALGAALGVAADPLPHQLATVHRVLSDTGVRHLLADEVGLGKTVQALMILNALRWQNPSHRAVIVAPERLLSQWNEECWTRAHIMTSLDPGPDENVAVRLLRPADLALRRDDGGRNAELDGDSQDMLIVDEPQTMPLEVVQYMARASENFRQVLVLSATPRLAEPRWREPILRMLEPEVSEMARRNGISVLEQLRRRETSAISQVQSGNQGIPLYRAAAANRRIIRSGREDWARYLPQRKNTEIVVSPLQSERERYELAANLPAMKSSDGTETQLWTAVKALQSNRRTAAPVMRDLADGNDLVAELARRAAASSMNDPGDSRLEALLEVLSENWLKNRSETFVIVCGNTPTMDLLEGVIPRYFPNLKGRVSRLDRLQRTEAASEITFRETMRILEQLLKGSSQVLLVGEWVQAGMNLHHFSRNIIFYSVPWKVDAIDQLIGRVDRLHPETIRNQKSAPTSVRIWRLVSAGSQEHSVVKLLSETGVFARPLPPLTDEALENLFLRQAEVARGQGSVGDRDFSDFDQSALLPTLMADLSPWNRESAEQFWENWSSQKAPEPAMSFRKSKPSNPIEAAENALSNWLDVIEKSQDFQVGWRNDKLTSGRKFATLWYGQGSGSAPRITFRLPQMSADRFMSDHKPFLKRRDELSSPPIRTVQTDEGEASERPLHFLDHGDPLHDAIVNGYLSRGAKAFGGSVTSQVAVRVPSGHPAEGLTGPVLLSTLMFDPMPDALLPKIWKGGANDIRNRATTEAQVRDLEREQARLRDGYLAAQRWMRLHIESTLGIIASRFDQPTRTWKNLSDQAVLQCLKPGFVRHDRALPREQRALWLSARSIPRALSQVPADAIAQELRRQSEALKLRAKKSYFEQVSALASFAGDYINLVRSERSSLAKIRSMNIDAIRSETVPEDQRTMQAGRVAAAERLAEMTDLVTEELVAFVKEAVTGRVRHDQLPRMSILLHIVAAE